ncbi:MAG: isoprenylcysteine carboxylmethyltransferase family protein [Pseudomonadota bacterium]
MRWLDIPPVWLLICVVCAYALTAANAPGSFDPNLIMRGIGGIMVASGLGLMILAVFEMRRHRTTVIPHLTASSLVTTGIFGYSRNPIYLGDLLILAGLCLRWGAVSALLLVPVLYWVLQKRFIEAEESRLSASFGPDFEAYRAATRRWI